MFDVNFSPSRAPSVAFLCAFRTPRNRLAHVLPLICFNMTLTAADRATGCLQSIATGDAIGKQTEMLSREDVVRWYPHGVEGFEGVPGAIIPRYSGNRTREWRVGETTDDTERTIAVAGAIIADSVASIAGGILGAMYPSTVNEHWYQTVEAVNQHQLVPMAVKLAKLRTEQS
jgi:ADP-ribosylglycohydrolase